uniref:ML domain-containing protein n=1 Tax=Panagrellus redivivus TaxID=6233 RepID=A0A7E4ZSV7_PANRE
MFRTVAAVLAFIAVCQGCDKFPNGTETALHWFQSCTGNTVAYDLQAFDGAGNPEYPVHLSQPLYVKLNLTNNAAAPYTTLSLSMKLSTWGGWTGCNWHELPTFGLLDNMNGCENGIPCPIPTGNNLLNVVVDFTKYDQIISLLTNDAPYQLEQIITDTVTGDKTCVTVQTRALIK